MDDSDTSPRPAGRVHGDFAPGTVPVIGYGRTGVAVVGGLAGGRGALLEVVAVHRRGDRAAAAGSVGLSVVAGRDTAGVSGVVCGDVGQVVAAVGANRTSELRMLLQHDTIIHRRLA